MFNVKQQLDYDLHADEGNGDGGGSAGGTGGGGSGGPPPNGD